MVDVAVVGQNRGVFSGSGQSAVCCRPLQSPASLSAVLEALAVAQGGLVTGLRRAGRWIPGRHRHSQHTSHGSTWLPVRPVDRNETL